MHEAMPNHFILPLEALPALAPRAALDGTVMRSVLRVHVGVRVEQVLRLEWLGRAAVVVTLEAPN